VRKVVLAVVLVELVASAFSGSAAADKRCAGRPRSGQRRDFRRPGCRSTCRCSWAFAW